MKKLFLLLMLLIAGKLQAQEYTLSGQVNSSAKDAARSLTVILYRSPDSVIMKTAVTDQTGKYSFTRIQPDNYYLIVKGIGFKTYRSG